MRIIALIPAHNERDTIGATVKALQNQIRPPDQIVVVCDNCVDDTEQVARAHGADTYVSIDNKHMKAGALNQALVKYVFRTLDDEDLVTCVDADTIVSNNFLSEAIKRFAEHPQLGGASGTYHGRRGHGYVGWCQRNEFARWGFDNKKEHGFTVILSGAASVFRVAALREVCQARAVGELGGECVYDVNTITEDFELSLALRTVGRTIVNMLNVNIETAVKPTWRTLFVQRRRWDRGINESLVDYGQTPYTKLIWRRRVVYALFVPISFLVIGLLTWRIASGEMLTYTPFWICITLIMSATRALSIIKTRGIWNAILAGTLVTEIAYDTFLQICFVRATIDQATSRSAIWR